MNIGLLSVRITVQKSTTQTDSIGNHMNAWQEYYASVYTPVDPTPPNGGNT